MKKSKNIQKKKQTKAAVQKQMGQCQKKTRHVWVPTSCAHRKWN